MRERKKELLWLLAGVLVLSVLMLLNQSRTNAVYQKESGRVIAIERSSLEQQQTIPLVVELEEQGEVLQYEVEISFTGSKEETQTSVALAPVDTNRVAVDEMIDTLEGQEELRIVLPKQLQDGRSVQWKTPTSQNPLTLLVLFPLLAGYLYQSDRSKTKKVSKRRCDEIRQALPGFNDQLLLMMNSGLVFQDALHRTTTIYGARANHSAFAELLCAVQREAEYTGRSVVSVMKLSTKTVSVREYSRLVNILADHQNKGIDLRQKLTEESVLLWEMRKSYALRKGKELETKLSFPLALLLIVLMLISGGPAMMNM